jgi:hypothetical protein
LLMCRLILYLATVYSAPITCFITHTDWGGSQMYPAFKLQQASSYIVLFVVVISLFCAILSMLVPGEKNELYIWSTNPYVGQVLLSN